MDDNQDQSPDMSVPDATAPETVQPGTAEDAATGSRTERSAARRRLRQPLIIAALAVITLVALGIAYQAFGARVEASRNIDTAKTLIERADDSVVQIDAVVLAEVTPELADKAVSAQRKAPRARSDLQKAISLLDDASQKANSHDRQLAALLKRTAVSRIAMLDAADKILPLNIAASRALTPARKGWDALLDADKASDSAVASYNKLTKAAVTESSRLNKRAASFLMTAQVEFTAAENAFSAAPFEQYLAYVESRKSLNKLSQQSDASWLKGDITKANSFIKQYNAGDKKSVGLAKGLPDAPEKAIADAYGELASEPTDAYYAARSAATTADKRLKDY